MVDIFQLEYPRNELYKLPASLLAKCQHYHSINPLFSYCCGLYCAQVTLILSDKLKDVESILSTLLQYLEETKPELNSIDDEKSANFHLRKELGGQLDHKYTNLVSIIQTSENFDLINFGQMVELLLELGFLYEVLRGLFPLKELRSEKEKELLEKELSDDRVEYRIHYCKTQAATILSIIKLAQNPLDYMSQLQMVPKDEEEVKDISEKQVDDLIQSVLKMSDTDLPNIDDDQIDEAKTGNEHEINDWSSIDDNFEGSSNGNKSLPIKSDPFDLPLAPVGFKVDNPAQSHQGSGIKDKKELSEKDPPTNTTMKATKPVETLVLHPPKDYTKEELQRILDKDTLLLLAIKDAKFAISALNYEDCDTAILKLQSAIDLIQKYKQ